MSTRSLSSCILLLLGLAAVAAPANASPSLQVPPTPTVAPLPFPTPTSFPSPILVPGGPWVCPHLGGFVSDAVIFAAVSNPESVFGWNRLRNAGAPESPFNRRQKWLTVWRTDRPYHPLYNSVRYAESCGSSDKLCTYGGSTYSGGSRVCQAGKVCTCNGNDGRWSCGTETCAGAVLPTAVP